MKKTYIVCDDNNKRVVCQGKLPKIVKLEANLYMRNYELDNPDLTFWVYDESDNLECLTLQEFEQLQ